MKTLRINADETLWRSSMLPERILERWLVGDGGTTRAGHAIAGPGRGLTARHRGAGDRPPVDLDRQTECDRDWLLTTLAVNADVAAGH